MPAPRMTNEDFLERINDLVGEEYTVLEPYLKSNMKVKFKHNSEKCDFHVWEAIPNTFLNRGARCPACSKEHADKKKRTITTQQFKDEVFDLVGDEYIVIGEYKNAKTKVNMIHNKEGCGHSWSLLRNNFLSRTRCPKCSKEIADEKQVFVTTNQFKDEIFELVGDEYIVIGEYINAFEKVKMKHNKENCGHVWEILRIRRPHPSYFSEESRTPLLFFILFFICG